MKKIITGCLLSMVLLMLCVLAGCGKASPEVKQLKEELTTQAVADIQAQFGYAINAEDYDVSFGEQTGADTFDDVKSLSTTNKLYLIGHASGTPKDILDFVLIYDPVSKTPVSLSITPVSGSITEYTY